MTTTTATTAPPRPTARRAAAVLPRVPYRGLFREPVYADGLPYDSEDEDEPSTDD
jgi:hypothetical protein